jgi:cold shock CspA family protein
MITHTGTIHWFSRLKGIGQIRPDAGGFDVLADIGDFVEMQPPGTLEQKLVAYQLDESAFGGRATQIHVVRRL